MMESIEHESFDLVDEPWILVKLLAGEVEELSLREVFRKASRIERLANDLPTQDFAILRVLLAVLQRSVVGIVADQHEYPSDAWGALWEAKDLPVAAIESYLNEWHHRFDLFDPDQPFMQTAGLTATNGTVSEVKKLIADVPDGKPLFSMKSLHGLESLEPNEAARWLVHVHAYDTSGIKTGVKGDSTVKGGKSYPIGTGWAGNLGGLYLEGANLAETLLLNLVLCDDCLDGLDDWVSEDDLPTWEQQQKHAGSSGRSPLGRADIYTWQSRRVRIVFNEGRATGVVLTNGDKLDAYNQMYAEAMSSWRRSINQEKKLKRSPIYLPYRHRPGRALWRGLTSILPHRLEVNDFDFLVPGVLTWASFLSSSNGGKHLPHDSRLKVHATAIEYGTQSSVVTELIDDSLTLSSFLLSEEGDVATHVAESCMERTDEAVAKALGGFAFRLRLAAGDDSTRAEGAGNAAKAEAYFELDAPFRSWLADLDPATDLPLAESHWNDLARTILIRLARQLIEEAGPGAIVGRTVKLGNLETWLAAGDEERRFYRQLSRLMPLENEFDKIGED